MPPKLNEQNLKAEQVEILEVHGARSSAEELALFTLLILRGLVGEKVQQGILSFSRRNMIYQSSGYALRGQKHHLVF